MTALLHRILLWLVPPLRKFDADMRRFTEVLSLVQHEQALLHARLLQLHDYVAHLGLVAHQHHNDIARLRATDGTTAKSLDVRLAKLELLLMAPIYERPEDELSERVEQALEAVAKGNA